MDAESSWEAAEEESTGHAMVLEGDGWTDGWAGGREGKWRPRSGPEEKR